MSKLGHFFFVLLLSFISLNSQSPSEVCFVKKNWRSLFINRVCCCCLNLGDNPQQSPRFVTQPSASASIVSEGRAKFLQCQAVGECLSVHTIFETLLFFLSLTSSSVPPSFLMPLLVIPIISPLFPPSSSPFQTRLVEYTSSVFRYGC